MRHLIEYKIFDVDAKFGHVKLKTQMGFLLDVPNNLGLHFALNADKDEGTKQYAVTELTSGCVFANISDTADAERSVMAVLHDRNSTNIMYSIHKMIQANGGPANDIENILSQIKDPKMNDQNLPSAIPPQQIQEPQQITKMKTAAAIMQENWPKMVQSAERAVAALNKIQSINNDEEDAMLEQLLVKVRTTYENISGMRKAYTSHLDELKAESMIPEKQISTDPKVPSLYNEKRKLRDNWANLKFQKAQQEKAAAELQLKQNAEIARVRAAFGQSVANGLFSVVSNVSNSISNAWMGLQLDANGGLSDMEAKLRKDPVLAKQVWEQWFNIQYDQSLIDPQVYAGMRTAALGEHSYDVCNQKFADQARPIIADWLGRIPAKIQELRNLAELQRSNQAEAERVKAENDRIAAEAAQRQAEALSAQNAQQIANIQQSQNEEMLGHHFNAQVANQNIEQVSGVTIKKVATLTCPSEDELITLVDLMQACMLNPAFPGLIKKDKGGDFMMDDEGRPVYYDWVEYLLDFYAKNCLPEQVVNIEVKETAKTSQRSKK